MLFSILKKYEAALPELFIVSQVSLKEDPSIEQLSVSAEHAGGQRCPRSWRWVPELVDAGDWGKVSPRCKQVLENL